MECYHLKLGALAFLAGGAGRLVMFQPEGTRWPLEDAKRPFSGVEVEVRDRLRIEALLGEHEPAVGQGWA